MSKTTITREYLTGERALFSQKNTSITDTIFADGESPLKESSNIDLTGCMFKWKYPLWYSNNISLDNCTIFEMGRAGIWYTNNLSIRNTLIEAPKNLRRCKNITLDNVQFPNASETLWNCDGGKMNNVSAKGDYFAMNCSNMRFDNFTLIGNYSFDGAKNIEIHNSKMLSKDSFWNSDNITVYDSFISGEYLGWNAKNLTLINCTIESLQGLCYIENLVMRNCKLINTNLAFEYSSADVEITGSIDSVKNPLSGRIVADSIGEIIMEDDKINPDDTIIICKDTQKAVV